MTVVVLLLLSLLSLLQPGAAADAAVEKAVRMKTSRQLKEMLTELNIKFPKDADKERLRSLAIKHDAVSKWESLHPEKKKKPPAMAKQDPNSMADMMLNMMDSDKDGRLSPAEMAAMGGGSAGQEESFKQMDTDGDGFASRAEVGAFFEMLSKMGGLDGMGGAAGASPHQGAGGGGGGGGSERKASQSSRKQQPPPPQQQSSSPANEEEDDDDELPSHDEL